MLFKTTKFENISIVNRTAEYGFDIIEIWPVQLNETSIKQLYILTYVNCHIFCDYTIIAINNKTKLQ